MPIGDPKKTQNEFPKMMMRLSDRCMEGGFSRR